MSDAAPVERFRLQPRFRILAIGALALGILLMLSSSFIANTVPALALGVVGALLGAIYLLSPTWALEVVVTDDCLSLERAHRRGAAVARWSLPWSAVERVIASPSTRTCFVDGGSTERSLIVPGQGAHAPYDIANKTALYEFILEHVDDSRVTITGLLSEYRKAEREGEGEGEGE